MASCVPEILPPLLEPTSEPPPIFDGTTRLYLNYDCPYCQRAWITRNIKGKNPDGKIMSRTKVPSSWDRSARVARQGLQDKIKLVAIFLHDKPAWYKEKVYHVNKVPALEHNGKVIGESLDVIKYIDTNFEGPSLLPDDPNKLSLAEEMMSYLDTYFKKVSAPLRGNQPVEEAGGEFDYLEKCLEKFDDGPFFLGQFSQVDAAYVPFIERPHIIFLALWNYDITAGRPKLAAYIQELNKIGAYRLTKCDPVALLKLHKNLLTASR